VVCCVCCACVVRLTLATRCCVQEVRTELYLRRSIEVAVMPCADSSRARSSAKPVAVPVCEPHSTFIDFTSANACSQPPPHASALLAQA
jgi:hypothetical protein